MQSLSIEQANFQYYVSNFSVFLFGLLMYKFVRIVAIMVGCGACGIAAIHVSIPMVAIYLFLLLLLNGLAIPVATAATVDLYATNMRGMGVCLSLMSGRLGAVVGSNIVAILVEDHCETTFYLAGSTLICKIKNTTSDKL